MEKGVILEKSIVWFLIPDKAQRDKFKFNQFWVESADVVEAVNICKEESTKRGFEIKVMGVTAFRFDFIDDFINKEFR